MSLPARPADLAGRPTTPSAQPLPGVARARFGLFRFRSPLLTESRLLSLPVGNEMFHFPTFPPHTLCVQVRVTGHDSCRVPPFGNPRITARLAAPQGLSQPPTSFIGSWCQGIHRMPLLTWPQRCSRPLCSSQTTTSTHPDLTTSPNHFGVVVRNGPAEIPHPRSAKSGPCVISGPNSVSTNPPARTLFRSHRPKPAVLRNDRTSVSELVSDPPEQPHQNQPDPAAEPVIAW